MRESCSESLWNKTIGRYELVDIVEGVVKGDLITKGDLVRHISE